MKYHLVTSRKFTTLYVDDMGLQYRAALWEDGQNSQ